MFTGIVEGIGKVVSIKRRGYNASFEISVDFDLGDVNVGDSISINGSCLTVTSRLGNHFWADLSDETLRVTTLGALETGSELNVERSVKVGGRMGGHIVQGHVDGVGKILRIQDVIEGKELEVLIPKGLARYVVDKGSITIDGVSLTINKVKGDIIFVRIIPHTVETTLFRNSKVGDGTNLEVDIIAKYVEKLRYAGSSNNQEESKIDEEFLRKHGF